MGQKFDGEIALTAGAITGRLVLVAISAYLSLMATAVIVSRAQKVHERVGALDRLLTLVLNAETAQRGSLLTGCDSDRERFVAASDRMIWLEGGRIDVSSEPGQGSEFIIVLPRLARGPRSEPDLSAVGGVTILGIDEGPDALESLQRAFENAGYTLLSANGHDEAVAGAPALAGLPIVAVTAHAVSGECESILGSGVDALLTKPIDEDLLLKEIRDCLAAEVHHA